MHNQVASPALVLGGSGFLGGHTVEALQSQGCEVRTFDRRRREPPLGVDAREGDFLDPVALQSALAGCRTVFHLIDTTLPETSNRNPLADVEANVLGTVRLLELAHRAGIEKIVFASSGGTVYGPPSTLPIPESHPTQPLCSYGVHKLAIEHYLRLYRTLHGLDSCVLRIANAFGERQSPFGANGAVTIFLNRALQDEVIEIWGDGSAIRDYVYAPDVAEGLCLAARASGGSHLFNVGSGQGRSLNELIASIEALIGRAVRRRHLPPRVFDVAANVLDPSLARTQLGWSPRHTFEEGLLRTFRWLSRGATQWTASTERAAS